MSTARPLTRWCSFCFNEELVDMKDDPLKRLVTTEESYPCRKIILSLGLLHFPGSWACSTRR